jgi:zinc protease
MTYNLTKRIISALCLCVFMVNFSYAQEPKPAPPKSVKIPNAKVKKLPNGLKVVVIEKRNLPLLTVQLQIPNGADSEATQDAGLASLTSTLLTKGTKTRSATEIAESMEFLGGSINSGASWNGSNVSIGITSDKINEAFKIFTDVILNPNFDQKEIDLLKTQTLDNLNYSLTQPGSLANFVASKFTFDEHPTGGTPKSIEGIDRKKILEFYQTNFIPENSTLIFTGDISSIQANLLAQKYFGTWKNPKKVYVPGTNIIQTRSPKTREKSNTVAKRLLVIDLPDSGQASVNFANKITDIGRIFEGQISPLIVNPKYYESIVLNSLFGGGYSSRLNQEVRIKRGLSYGAGSSFNWRINDSNFVARCQTKNESAAEVAELIIYEIERLTTELANNNELNPRKNVLIGDFRRDLETTNGLNYALSDLYLFNLSPNELNKYMDNVRKVTPEQVRDFAKENLKGGDIIIVGDYKIFKDDLAKRFPKAKVEVIKASELDLNSNNLRK